MTTIPPTVFPFLRELAKNNTREWFSANKARYVETVRDPVLGFIGAFEPRLERVSPHFVCDARAVGGSMFRLHRDTRFGKDKSPYKTHIGMQFRHELGRDAHCPGFYLHLEPGRCFVGAGMWHPDGASLKAIRERIGEHPGEWAKVKKQRAIAGGAWKLEGESLKRPPRGFDAEHPHMEDLKRKDFMLVKSIGQGEVSKPGFAAGLAKDFKEALPLVGFLCGALGLES